MEAETQKNSRCTAEADLELLSRYQAGDEEALKELLKSHDHLTRFWVRKALAVVPTANREDVIQEARIGFYQAAAKFNVSENADFHTQARNSIKRAVYKSSAIRRVSRTLYKNYTEVMKAQARLIKKLNREPTLEELAAEAKLSVRQVDTALNVIAAFPFPLEEADAYLAIGDPYDTQLLKNAIGKLSADDAEVIRRHHFYGQTDPEIAANLGLATGTVKMRRHRAESKLRDIISGEGDRKDGT
jgi:RNA polymerase sporulation-specific sigma factor